MNEDTSCDDIGDISFSELLSFKKELLEEKQLLRNLLTLYDHQINTLEIERMHILSTRQHESKEANDSQPNDSKENDADNKSTKEPLNLSLSTKFYPRTAEEEEEEEEDENEND